MPAAGHPPYDLRHTCLEPATLRRCGEIASRAVPGIGERNVATGSSEELLRRLLAFVHAD